MFARTLLPSKRTCSVEAKLLVLLCFAQISVFVVLGDSRSIYWAAERRLK